MSKNVKGGGIGSKQHVSKPVRTGAPRHGVNPRWTSQVGQSYGNHSTEHSALLPREKIIEKYRQGPGVSVPLGNEVATNVGRGGPGAGRTLYGQSGMNAVHGPVAGSPKPQGRDILSEYGHESAGALRRR